MEKEIGTSEKFNEFLEIFRKGEELTKDLIRENERLRLKLAQMQEAIGHSIDKEKIMEYENNLRSLKEEIQSLTERYTQVEEENKDFATKYIEVEEINNALANLYVASYQLHSTLDFNEVLRIITEIIINLIGAEIFVILLHDERTNEILPASAEGVAIETVPKGNIGEGIVGTVAQSGESYFAADIRGKGDVAGGAPIVCIPLKIKEHIIGVIAIYSLLVHKENFTNVDYELFNLLAGHAATAIFAARLYNQRERKLSTIQSFLDLLKEKPKERK